MRTPIPLIALLAVTVSPATLAEPPVLADCYNDDGPGAGMQATEVLPPAWRVSDEELRAVLMALGHDAPPSGVALVDGTATPGATGR